MGKVLIIEDNEYSAKIIEYAIKEAVSGVEIIWAVNAERAYKMAMDYQIDLFIVDIVLNPKSARDASGLSFARNIRKTSKYKMTPLIFISSKQVSQLELYKNIHCYSFLEKPISESELRELVQNIFCKNICNPGHEFIDFRINGIIYPVRVDEITYIEYIKGILGVHTVRDILKVPYISLAEVERKLEDVGFMRCSKSVIVNRNFVRSYDFVNEYVELVDGYGSLEMGSVMKKRIRNWMR